MYCMFVYIVYPVSSQLINVHPIIACIIHRWTVPKPPRFWSLRPVMLGISGVMYLDLSETSSTFLLLGIRLRFVVFLKLVGHLKIQSINTTLEIANHKVDTHVECYYLGIDANTRKHQGFRCGRYFCFSQERVNNQFWRAHSTPMNPWSNITVVNRHRP